MFTDACVEKLRSAVVVISVVICVDRENAVAVSHCDRPGVRVYPVCQVMLRRNGQQRILIHKMSD